MLVSYRNATWGHNPEDLDLNFQHGENLKSRFSFTCSVCWDSRGDFEL